MDYYKLVLFIFIGIFILHVSMNYPERFLIYPTMNKNLNNNNKIVLDIVITYVDGNDEKWLKKKSIDLNNNSNEIFSFNTNLEEIKYCVLSIEKYFKNQYRNIYFVTNNGKLPKSIKPKKNYIPILYSDLVGYRTYNSTVIEANIHKINGLSEYYLYFNDDFILNKNLTINDFIDIENDKLIWYKETDLVFQKSTGNFRSGNNFLDLINIFDKGNLNKKIINYFLKLLTEADRGRIESLNRTKKILDICVDFNIGHNPRIFKKSMVMEFIKIDKVKEELKKNKNRLLRSEDDFCFVDGFCLYFYNQNKIIVSSKYKTKIMIQMDNKYYSKIYNSNYNNNYHFLSIEDMRENNKTDKNIKKILDKKFKLN